MSVVGELHVQLGPIFRAVILSSCADAASIKSQLERTFDENPYDPDASKMERSRECVVLRSNESAGSEGVTSASVLLDLPKMDLPASLPSDCIDKMVRTRAELAVFRFRQSFLYLALFGYQSREPKKERMLGSCESKRWTM